MVYKQILEIERDEVGICSLVIDREDEYGFEGLHPNVVSWKISDNLEKIILRELKNRLKQDISRAEYLIIKDAIKTIESCHRANLDEYLH